MSLIYCDDYVQAFKDAAPKDPVSQCNIVFADGRWNEKFKLDMMKSGSVLMNCHQTDFESFFSHLLTDDRTARIVKADYLGYYLVKKLTRKPLGGTYVFDNAGQMDYVKLDDFARILAGLFVKYEKWNVNIDIQWQKELYDSVIKEIADCGCYTLKSLYESNKRKNKGTVRFSAGGTLFVFGAAVLEPLYMELVEAYAERNNVVITSWIPKREIEAGIGNCRLPVELCSAPGRMREMENIHSKICELLDSGAAPEDIAVFFPDTGKYFSQIMRNFNQGHPYIPFTVRVRGDSLTKCALETLKAVFFKKWFSRKDFVDLLNNAIVRFSCGLSLEDADAIKSWIDRMNVYRDRDAVDDWNEAVKRLLLSRLTDGEFCFEGKAFRPFSDMNNDNGLLFRFVRMVDALEQFKGFGSMLSHGELEQLHDCLATLMGGVSEEESLKGEARVFSSISHAIRSIEAVFANEPVSSAFVLNSLLLAAKGHAVVHSNTKTGGVLFCDLSCPIKCKYSFFAGMGLASYPRERIGYSFDCSDGKTDELDDRDLFFLQLLNTLSKACISYDRQDLKKDAEMYISPLVSEFYELTGVKKTEMKLHIDENRDVAQLWSAGELRRKMLLPHRTPRTVKISGFELPKNDVFSLYDLKLYLADPFQYAVNKVFPYDFREMEVVEYEPVEMSYLDRGKYLKKYVQKKIENPEYSLAALRHELENDGFFIPDKVFADNCLLSVGGSGDRVYERLAMLSDIRHEAVKNEDMLEFDYRGIVCGREVSFFTPGSRYHISGPLKWHVETADGLVVVDCKARKPSEYVSAFLDEYVTALCLLAQKSGDDSHEVNLGIVSAGEADNIVYHGRITQSVYSYRHFCMKPREAAEMLEAVCIAMNDDYSCFPAELLHADKNGKPKYEDVKNLHDLEKVLKGQNGLWKNFQKRDFFNILHDIGYRPEDFAKKWAEVAKRQSSFIAWEKR